MRDACWVKSRIAARILLRAQRGGLQARDLRRAAQLAKDPGVTDRLIDQALACLCGQKGLGPEGYHAILRTTLVS